jgi:hypothetical protein
VVLAAAVQFSAVLLRWNYHPLKYQHATNPTDNTRRRHHMFNQLRVQADEHMLTYEKGAQQVLSWSAGGRETPEQSTSHIPMPPLHIQQRLLHTLDGVSAWFDPVCRATVQHMPLRPRPPPEPPPVIHTDTHYAVIWADVQAHIFSLFTSEDNLWVWAPAHTALGDMQQFCKVCAV